MNIIKKTRNDIKAYVRSLNTPENIVYQENEFIILACFSKTLEILEENENLSLTIPDVSISVPDYEYEMFIDDKGTPFEIDGWIPIATDMIKDQNRIEEYIKKGMIRKRE